MAESTFMSFFVLCELIRRMLNLSTILLGAIYLLAFKSSFTFWKSQILFPKFKLFGKLDSILLIKPNKLFQEELILFFNGYIKQLENLKLGKKSHLHIFTPYEN